MDDSGFEDNDLDLSGLDLDSDLGDFGDLDGDFESDTGLENDLEDFESSNEDDLDSLDSLDDLSGSEFTEDENYSLPDLGDFDIDNSTEELDSLDDFETEDDNFETDASDDFDTSDFGELDIPEDESIEDNFENGDDFDTSDDFEDNTEFDNENTDSLDEPEQEETYEEENSIANDLFDIDETEESSDTDELFETEPEEEEQEIEEEEAEIVNTSVSDNNSKLLVIKVKGKVYLVEVEIIDLLKNQQQQSGFSQVEMAELRKMLDTYNRRGHCMVVSGTSNSGSTTLAGNIANVVASLSYTVAIVDFDLSKRGQTYLSKDAFLAVNNSGDNYSDTLMKVINNKNSNISANGAIIKAGLNLFGTNVEEDTPDIEKVIRGKIS